MLQSVLQYLIESTLYLITFLLIYRLFLSKLTHFTWMRVFLLGGLALGLILPLITLPLNWHHMLPGASSIDKPLNLTFLNVDSTLSQRNPGNPAPEKNPITFWGILGYGLNIFYLSVVIYKLNQLSKKLLSIRSSIRNNLGEKKDGYWFIHLKTTSPAFSFFNYIFISKHLGSMGNEEIERISSHEIIHAKQYHTADILFIELVSVLFWFNPLIRIFKEYLQEVHEYLADENILKNKAMKQSYSNLLLKLTTEENPPILSSAFSARQISRRIRMIEKSKSLPQYRILFFLLLPVAVFLLMSFSYLETRSNPNPLTVEPQASTAVSANQHKVGKITWVNNTIYSDAQLNKKLGIKSGDDYSIDHLNQRLWGLDAVSSMDAVSSLYLDNGYLFFQAEVEENPKDDGFIDLTITIYEGLQVKIRQILITGNGNIPKKDILEKILIQQGELFSKTKLINSVHAIAQMDQFDLENILPNPTPIKDPLTGEFTLVDIEFKLTEKK